MAHAGSSGEVGLPLGVTRKSTNDRLKQSQTAASEPARVHGHRACRNRTASQLKSLPSAGRNHPCSFHRQASRTMITSAGNKALQTEFVARKDALRDRMLAADQEEVA